MTLPAHLNSLIAAFDVETIAQDIAAAFQQLDWNTAPQTMRQYWTAYTEWALVHITRNAGNIELQNLFIELGQTVGDPSEEWVDASVENSGHVIHVTSMLSILYAAYEASKK